MEKLVLKADKSIFLVDFLLEKGFSKGAILSMLKNKDIRVNANRTKNDILLNENDEITLFYLPKSQEYEKIYEDDNIAIINKPANIEVEGEGGICDKLGILPVHRLDRNTTGILVTAKNKEAQNLLFEAFKNKKITKKYYAEVVGKTNYKNWTFNAYLVKDSKESMVKIFTSPVPKSQPISTTFNTIKSTSTSLIECTLHTGKTHQIRASLAYLGHPIIGDGKYGKNEDNKRFKAKYQRLHAYYLKFSTFDGSLSYLSGKEFTCLPPWLAKKEDA